MFSIHFIQVRSFNLDSSCETIGLYKTSLVWLLQPKTGPKLNHDPKIKIKIRQKIYKKFLKAQIKLYFKSLFIF